MMVEAIEQFFRDGIVMTFAMPLGHQLAGVGVDGARITPAEMDAKSHTRETFDERVVSVDGSLEVSFRVFAAGAHSIQRYFVDIGGVTRRVDLDVFAALLHDLGNHLPLNCDDMVDKVIESFVNVH